MPLEDLTKEELILEHIDLRRKIGELEILERERRRAEVALRESKEWYENLFENSPISLWVEDYSEVKKHLDALREKGVEDFYHYFEENPKDVYHCASLIKVLDVNQATLDLYQAMSKQELLSDLGHIFTPESWSAFRDILAALAMGTTTFEIETVNQKLSGEIIHIVLRWNIATGYEDSCAKAFISILDITKRKRYENALKYMEWTFDSAVHPVAFANPDGIITYANAAFIREWGYRDSTEVVGRPMIQFWNFGDQAEDVAEAVRSGKKWRGELTARRWNDSTFKVLFTVHSITDKLGRPLSMIGSITTTAQQGLNGVLPICSHCKKIRDESDSWHSVESYLSDRSSAKFSHSLCPECSSKLYPKRQED
jgi:PAS domain-containing protein